MTKQDRYRAKHKIMGLCHDCSEKSIDGHRCQKHKISQRGNSDRHKQKLIGEGRCRSCGGEKIIDVDDNYTECINCRERLRTPKWKEYSVATTDQGSAKRPQFSSFR